MTIIRYYAGAERPDITLTWRDASGAIIDLATGYTFELKIGSPGVTAEVTKTTGITGAQTAPNVTIAFLAAELDALPTGRYSGQLRARNTATSQDRYMRFWFYYIPAVL
jgi:hypothetical protein